MKFFADFENVNSRGFLGAEYLLPEDEVLLFYSKCCNTLERDVLDKLYASGCAFSLCRLERTGRNALDFYITSNIGEVLGRGYSGIIAIVSHDRGFQAIYDYWKTRKCPSSAGRISPTASSHPMSKASGENRSAESSAR